MALGWGAVAPAAGVRPSRFSTSFTWSEVIRPFWRQRCRVPRVSSPCRMRSRCCTAYGWSAQGAMWLRKAPSITSGRQVRGSAS